MEITRKNSKRPCKRAIIINASRFTSFDSLGRHSFRLLLQNWERFLRYKKKFLYRNAAIARRSSEERLEEHGTKYNAEAPSVKDDLSRWLEYVGISDGWHLWIWEEALKTGPTNARCKGRGKCMQCMSRHDVEARPKPKRQVHEEN